MRKLRSPNQKTTLKKNSQFKTSTSTYVLLRNTSLGLFSTDISRCKGCGDLLVVENTSGRLALKLLLLQDALKVLHALPRVFHVSRQVAVEEADGVSERRHAGANTTFIPL